MHCERWIVSNCAGCPFCCFYSQFTKQTDEIGFCTRAKQALYSAGDSVPDWCPLREHASLVDLLQDDS